jgi:hypothetical protein
VEKLDIGLEIAKLVGIGTKFFVTIFGNGTPIHE